MLEQCERKTVHVLYDLVLTDGIHSIQLSTAVMNGESDSLTCVLINCVLPDMILTVDCTLCIEKQLRLNVCSVFRSSYALLRVTYTEAVTLDCVLCVQTHAVTVNCEWCIQKQLWSTAC